MSKIKLLLVSLVALLVLWISSWFSLFSLFSGNSVENKSITTEVSESQNVNNNIEVEIIFGENNIVSGYISPDDKQTAFSALEEIAGQNDIAIKTKKYDFGVFVESIDGSDSGSEKSWIYFVNGESGQVAADTFELKPGDKLEWKYIAPEGV